VIKTDEEIFEMNNGCICCTVRGDLIRVLGNLMKRRDRFDRIVVETTGMANPGPVAQTFFVDDDVQAEFRIDGIVTLVDAKHLELHLGHQQEAYEQIAFADVIVLNKIDLAEPARLDELERRLRGINAMARILRARHGAVPLGEVLDVGGFDLTRALAIRPSFLDPEYPFEWAGVYELAEGAHQLQLSAGPDPAMRIVIERAAGADPTGDAAAERVSRVMAEPPSPVAPGGVVAASGLPFELALAHGEPPWLFTVPVAEAGRYAMFTQHLPAEFQLRLANPDGRGLAPIAQRELVASHTHDDSVGSVGLEFDRSFDEARLNAWLGKLLRERGGDIFRMKGILAIAGSEQRFVFQGVHMLFDGRPDVAWGDRPRRSQIVFIGKDLDRAALREGLRACLA